MHKNLRSFEYRELESSIRIHDLVPAENLDELYVRPDVQIIPQALLMARCPQNSQT